MSKPIVKFDQKKVFKPNSLTHPVAGINNKQYNPPSIREVNLPVQHEEQSNVVTAYKDLNQLQRLQEFQQTKHLFTAFFVFILLGFGIVFGQQFFNKKQTEASTASQSSAEGARDIANSEMAQLIPKEAQESAINTHYHYDKTCYLAENGQQVCLTRTSQKNR